MEQESSGGMLDWTVLDPRHSCHHQGADLGWRQPCCPQKNTCHVHPAFLLLLLWGNCHLPQEMSPLVCSWCYGSLAQGQQHMWALLSLASTGPQALHSPPL